MWSVWSGEVDWWTNGWFRGENPYKFPVFHAGPRICLGKEMAYIQMKSIVAAVLEVPGKDRPEYLLSMNQRRFVCQGTWEISNYLLYKLGLLFWWLCNVCLCVHAWEVWEVWACVSWTNLVKSTIFNIQKAKSKLVWTVYD